MNKTNSEQLSRLARDTSPHSSRKSKLVQVSDICYENPPENNVNSGSCKNPDPSVVVCKSSGTECDIKSNISCLQINLHKCKAASYNLSEVISNTKTGLVFVQEPWTYVDKVRGKLQGWKLFQGNQSGERPRACIYATPNLKCQPLPIFSSRDITAVMVSNVFKDEDECVFVSAYMAAEDTAPPQVLRRLVLHCQQKQIPLIVGTDANAHHTLWGSSDINKRGEELLEFCAASNLEICNVGKKPTFRTRNREEVLDLTLANEYAFEKVSDWHVSDVPSLSDHMYIRFAVLSSTKSRDVMIRNIHRTCWSKYVAELDHRLNEYTQPFTISSIEEIDECCENIQNVIVNSFKAACPLRKLRMDGKHKKWWNPELALLRQEVRQAHRKAIKTKAEIDWEAKKRAQARFKKAVRKAQRESWKQFTQSIEGLSPTARLVKAVKKNKAAQLSCIQKEDGGLTESPESTLNYLLDALAPGSLEIGNDKLVNTQSSCVTPADENFIASICSTERMKAAIDDFEPYKSPGQDGIYPVLLQKGWEYIKDHYCAIFKACLRYGYVPKSWRTGSGVFLPKPGKNNYFEVKSFRMITLTSFQLKWLERLILYKLNEDSKIQDKISGAQYGFRAGVSTETALHEFVLRIERNLAKKRPALGVFLDIAGAFDNIKFSAIERALLELEVPNVLIHWIKFMLGHRTVKASLYGKDVTRKMERGCPQGGILSPFLWNCVINSLLLKLEREGIYNQAYADDLALLIPSSSEVYLRCRAQQALNIATEWANINGLQFSEKKTEIVLFSHKRKFSVGTLRLNGKKLNLSEEARLLGVTLDSKLTWKNHITNVSKKAVSSLMQCKQFLGKMWGMKPKTMKWIYTAMVRPIVSYACVSWVSAIEKLYLRNILQRVQRLACLMITSAFPSTPTAAMEVLMNIQPIDEFIRAEAIKGSYRLDQAGHWFAGPVGTSGNIRSHADVCNNVRKELPLLCMPADKTTKSKVFKRNFECLVFDRKGATEYLHALKESSIKAFTDGSKLNAKVGAGFRIENPNDQQLQESSFFLGSHGTVFQAEVFAISAVAEYLLLEGVRNQKIAILTDSQAAIGALKCTVVQSRLVWQCIENLNKVGESNCLQIAWIPGHSGIPGNEAADNLAKSGSQLSMLGPEPFIPVPYASCVQEIKNWSLNRWKTSWDKRKDCRKTKEVIDWVSPRLSNRLLSLHRPQLHSLMQVITGHCNLQKHKVTTGRATQPCCPKCGTEDETPDHHVERCQTYQDVRAKCFGKQNISIKTILTNSNVKSLARYLSEAGRLTEYEQ